MIPFSECRVCIQRRGLADVVNLSRSVAKPDSRGTGNDVQSDSGRQSRRWTGNSASAAHGKGELLQQILDYKATQRRSIAEMARGGGRAAPLLLVIQLETALFELQQVTKQPDCFSGTIVLE